MYQSTTSRSRHDSVPFSTGVFGVFADTILFVTAANSCPHIQMYRERLLVKSGCLRCKKRRKKCDEQKPKCGFCSRWRLDCHWPQALTRPPRTRRGHVERNEDNEHFPSSVNHERQHQKSLVVPSARTIALDPFHELPIVDATRRVTVAGYLSHFFTSMIGGALPFDFLSTRLELAHGWARSAFADDAVCYAFAAYCARLQSKSAVGDRQERHALEFEKYAVATLRSRLHSGAQPTEHTILVAALHFVMLAFEDVDTRELVRIGKGIRAMLEACGGTTCTLKRMQTSTIQSLEICDMFCAFLNSAAPMYSRVRQPRPPTTLVELGVTDFAHTQLETDCGPCVMAAMRTLHVILHFRQPSRQSRTLTTEEASYLYQLLRYSENQLGFLQAQYAGSSTLSEVLVLAMMVVKREVIPLHAQHVALQTVILRRLYAAIVANIVPNLPEIKLQHNVLIWACLVALVGSGVEKIRAEFQDMIVQLIQLKYMGDRWRPDWTVDLRQRLQALLWHTRIEIRYHQLCGTVVVDVQI